MKCVVGRHHRHHKMIMMMIGGMIGGKCEKKKTKKKTKKKKTSWVLGSSVRSRTLLLKLMLTAHCCHHCWDKGLCRVMLIEELESLSEAVRADLEESKVNGRSVISSDLYASLFYYKKTVTVTDNLVVESTMAIQTKAITCLPPLPVEAINGERYPTLQHTLTYESRA